MIKGVGEVSDKRGTRPVLIQGLTRENITRLVAGEPIRFEAADIGLPPMQVVVMFGENEAAIMTELRPAFARETTLHVPPRRNGGKR